MNLVAHAHNVLKGTQKKQLLCDDFNSLGRLSNVPTLTPTPHSVPAPGVDL